MPTHQSFRNVNGGLIFFLIISTIVIVFITVAGAGAGYISEPTATQQATLTPTPMPTYTRQPAPTSSPKPTWTLSTSTTPTRRVYPTLTLEVGRVNVPVLLYHHIADAKGAGARYYTSMDNFREQMQFLSDQGYQTILMRDLIAALLEEKPLPDKPVLLTFDDGHVDVYVNAFPILAKLDFTATLYVIGKDVESQAAMTHDMIQTLAAAGWEIGSHSMTHADLVKTADAIDEVCTSRYLIENTLGVTVDSFSYPYGSANTFVKNLVRDCGYTSGVGLGLWVTHKPENRFFISRREVEGDFDMEQFKALLRNVE